MNNSEYHKKHFQENKPAIMKKRAERSEENKIYQAKYYQRTKLKKAKDFQKNKLK
jgi:hypothetical protein